MKINDYVKVGKAAGWLGTGEKSPPISAIITLTEGDLRSLFAHLRNGEVKLSVGLFNNPRYVQGTSMPAWTGDGSIRVSREEVVVATPQVAQAKQRKAKVKATMALAPKVQKNPNTPAIPQNPVDIASIVAAVIAAMPKASNDLPY